MNKSDDLENYQAFEGLNLSNQRGENETYIEYKTRLKENQQMLKIYSQLGRENTQQMFPIGLAEAIEEIRAARKEASKEKNQEETTTTNDQK